MGRVINKFLPASDCVFETGLAFEQVSDYLEYLGDANCGFGRS